MKVLKQFTCLAVIAVMAAILGACSSDNDLVTDTISSEPSATRTITFTAGPLGGDAETRVSLTDNGSKIKSAWEVEDIVGISYYSGKVEKFITGKVISVTEGIATISAAIDETLDDNSSFVINYPALDNDDYTNIYAKNILTNQKGTLDDIQDSWVYFLGKATVSGNAIPSEITMDAKAVIWKLTFISGSTDITSKITELKIQFSDYTYTVTPSSQSAIYVCLANFMTPRKEDGTITLTAKTADNEYVLTKAIAKDFMYGKFYQSAIAFTDLSTITSAYKVKNGETLTGTLGEKVKLSVEAGAKVTLSNVTINGTNDSFCEWAGINCLGDATITLVGNNTVMGSHNGAGIHVLPGNRLTIDGDGSLTAGSNSSGAGIGSGYQHASGDIWIISGTITATGGEFNAGIGGGDQSDSCGEIVIAGGTITAKGGYYAAGIGTGRGTSGSSSSCGDITIGEDAKVTATKGAGAPYSIGRGYSYGDTSGTDAYSDCGTITIATVVKAQSEFKDNTFTYPTE